MEKVNSELVKYVKENIQPRYNQFDNGHNINHVNSVIERSLKLAEDYNLDYNMCYTIAAYHDIGLEYGRERHHIFSAIEVEHDSNLLKWFNKDEIKIISEACGQHRASLKSKPNTIYGCVVSDADKSDTIETMIYRSYSYHIVNDKNKDMKSISNAVYNHLKEKYGKTGYANYYLDKSQDFRKEAIDILEDRKLFDNVFDSILEELE